MRKTEADGIPLILAEAAFRATTHIFRVLANRELVSPQDIRESTSGVIAILEGLPKDLHGSLRENVLRNYEDIEQVAAANWKSE